MSKLKMPDFLTEAEEAAWWFDNQDALAQEYAEENGTEFLLIEKEDAELVQSRAEALGISTKAYIKQLLHSDRNQAA